MRGTDAQSDQSMTVARLAEAAGVAPHVVRLYARRGLLASDTRTSSGYRLFDQRDLKRLRFIRTAASLGFSLAEIGQIIDLSRRGQSACPLVREILQHRLDQARTELKQLERMHKRMGEALRSWESLPDRIPSGDDVCHLIESVGDGAISGDSGILQRRLGLGPGSDEDQPI